MNLLKKKALKRVFNLFKIVEELNGKWTYSNYFHLIFVEEIQLRNWFVLNFIYTCVFDALVICIELCPVVDILPNEMIPYVIFPKSNIFFGVDIEGCVYIFSTCLVLFIDIFICSICLAPSIIVSLRWDYFHNFRYKYQIPWIPSQGRIYLKDIMSSAALIFLHAIFFWTAKKILLTVLHAIFRFYLFV